MTGFPDEIETEVCLLRPMASKDLAMVETHLSDPEIARWMAAVKHPFGRRDAEEILALSAEPSRGIRILEKDGVMIGCLGLSPDVWYWLDRGARGNGIMFHALRKAISAYFTRLAPPLIATCRDDNLSSQALLSRLGFSRIPVQKRMFFQIEGGAQPCHDHVMTSEQWLQLHPPILRQGSITLRPATQKDASTLMLMLPSAETSDEGIWPQAETLNTFIETHRCRTAGQGLFVAEDEHRRVIAMVLLHPPLSPDIRYLSKEDNNRHAQHIETLLASAFPDEGC